MSALPLLPSPLRRVGDARAPALGLLAAFALSACGVLAPQQAPVSVDTGAAPPAVPAPSPPSPPPPPPQRPPPEPADARPRVERLNAGAPNHAYEIKGERYEPGHEDVPLLETGIASWYGRPFHGRRTASGERYDMNAMTAAHKTMPLPSYALVRNLANGRQVVVRVNDRGPFVKGRVIDLSRAAARKLRIHGLGRVEVRRLTNDEIRTGSWKLPPQRLATATN
ncbi:MAG: septal ring lytic transglycosylase RlpA family protein [Ideonella sp.]|nr:septal ring lytic transglycosylase RlpA family protein [Ideonella sp.]MCC7457647.1 septal ring lytic transglycosylase RlpA family protein [Nitrospira sp.]